MEVMVSRPGKTRQNPPNRYVMSPNRSKLKDHLYPLSITKGTLAFLSGPSLIMDWVVHNAELNFLKSRVIFLILRIFRDLSHHEGEDGADVGVAVDEVGRPIWIFWTIFQFVMATYWVDAPIGTMFNFLDV